MFSEGHDDVDTKYKVYNEDDWSNTNSKKMLNYSKSKTLAERAAWDFVKNIKRDNFCY
jgi:dihydroflavonol-4-reductase